MIARLNQLYDDTAPIMQKFRGELAPLEDKNAQEKILGPNVWQKTLTDNPTFSAAHPELTRKEYKEMVRTGVISEANAAKIDRLYNERMDERINYIRKGQKFDPRETKALQSEYLKLGIDPDLADSGLMSHITGSTRRRIKLRDNYIDTFRDTLLPQNVLGTLKDFNALDQSTSFEEARQAVSEMDIGLVPQLSLDNLEVYHNFAAPIKKHVKNNLSTWYGNNPEASGADINDAFQRFGSHGFNTDEYIKAENLRFKAEINEAQTIYEHKLADKERLDKEHIYGGVRDPRQDLTDQHEKNIAKKLTEHQTMIGQLRGLAGTAKENYITATRYLRTIEDPAKRAHVQEIISPMLAGMNIAGTKTITELIKGEGITTAKQYINQVVLPFRSKKEGVGFAPDSVHFDPLDRTVLKELNYDGLFSLKAPATMTAESSAAVDARMSGLLTTLERPIGDGGNQENIDLAKTIRELRESSTKDNPSGTKLLEYRISHYANALAENNRSNTIGGSYILGRDISPEEIFNKAMVAAYTNTGEDAVIERGVTEGMFLDTETIAPTITTFGSPQHGYGWVKDQIFKTIRQERMSSREGGVGGGFIETTMDGKKEASLDTANISTNSREGQERIVTEGNESLRRQREAGASEEQLTFYIQKTEERDGIEYDRETDEFEVTEEQITDDGEEVEVPDPIVDEKVITDAELQEVIERVGDFEGYTIERLKSLPLSIQQEAVNQVKVEMRREESARQAASGVTRADQWLKEFDIDISEVVGERVEEDLAFNRKVSELSLEQKKDFDMLINRRMSREQAYIHVAPEVLEEVSEEDKEEIREAIKIARSGEPTIPPQQASRQTAFEEADQRYTPLPSTPRKPRKVSANKYRSLLESDEQLNARQSQQKKGLENLLSHHRDTMTSGNFEVTDEGRTHTLWSTLHKEAPNLWRLIPGFWDGERVSEEEAYRRAKEEGISNYPAFKSREEAMAADAILHEEIEEDMQNRVNDF